MHVEFQRFQHDTLKPFVFRSQKAGLHPIDRGPPIEKTSSRRRVTSRSNASAAQALGNSYQKQNDRVLRLGNFFTYRENQMRGSRVGKHIKLPVGTTVRAAGDVVGTGIALGGLFKI